MTNDIKVLLFTVIMFLLKNLKIGIISIMIIELQALT